MLIGSSVPITKSATSAMIETHSGPMRVLRRSRPARLVPRPCDEAHGWLSGLANRSMVRLSIVCPHVSIGAAPPHEDPALRAGGRTDHHLDRVQRTDGGRPATPRARARPAP